MREIKGEADHGLALFSCGDVLQRPLFLTRLQTLKTIKATCTRTTLVVCVRRAGCARGRRDNLFGGVCVNLAETGALASASVNAIEGSAADAPAN